jgi:hypothetical protein
MKRVILSLALVMGLGFSAKNATADVNLCKEYGNSKADSDRFQ